jgi:hypothetical protein
MPREQQAGERHLYNLDFVWRTPPDINTFG